MLDQYWNVHDLFGIRFRSALRSLQCICAVVVAVLYAVDLGHATKLHLHAEPNWIYAEVVDGLSIFVCTLPCFLRVNLLAWTAWDWVLTTLWSAQFGVFASIYLAAFDDGDGQQEETEYSSTTSVTRMKVALWFDLVNMVLWLVTATTGLV